MHTQRPVFNAGLRTFLNAKPDIPAKADDVTPCPQWMRFRARVLEALTHTKCTSLSAIGQHGYEFALFRMIDDAKLKILIHTNETVERSHTSAQLRTIVIARTEIKEWLWGEME